MPRFRLGEGLFSDIDPLLTIGSRGKRECCGKNQRGCRARECRSGRLGAQTRGVPDFVEEARGAWSGEISPDVSAGRRDGKIRVTARKLGIFQSVGNSGNRGESRERRGGAARRGGAEGIPARSRAGPDSSCLEGSGGRNRRCPCFLSSRASDPAGQRCRMPEPWRSRPPKAHRCEAFSDAASKRRRFASPAERAATRPMLSAISAESRPKEKAACVSGGSAERPQFSRTGRARQRGRRSRRREPDPAGVFSTVMHPMIRREAFRCNRSGAGIFRKGCRATERWHDLGAWRRERRRNRAQRRVKVLSPPPGAACCVCGEMMVLSRWREAGRAES